MVFVNHITKISPKFFGEIFILILKKDKKRAHLYDDWYAF